MTGGSLKTTKGDMNILMDADCLIKLTKAGLKELVTDRCSVYIPAAVVREVVDAGKEKGCPDAFVVEENIGHGRLAVVGADVGWMTGDEALPRLFSTDKFTVVASDDAKLLRRLRTGNIPCLLPAVLLYRFQREGLLSREQALDSLERLSGHISLDEYGTVRLLMEGDQ